MSTLALVLVLALLGGRQARGVVHYCGQETPLTTEYVAPFYEATRPVQGCVSSEKQADNGHLVVVVRTNTTSKDVLLTLTEISADGIVIILDSPVAIRWRLSFFGPEKATPIKRRVILAPGSILEESNAHVDVLAKQYDTLKVSPKMSDEKFGSIVRQYYGGLSMLAQVTGANRVSLSFSDNKAVHLAPTCKFDSLTSITDSVLSFLVVKQKMFGCYHPEVAGTMPTDVHIIDLVSAEPTSLQGLNNVDDEEFVRYSRSSHSDESQLPAVVLSMTPKQGEKEEIVDSSPRNITLILKSAMPVRWYLESWRMKGFLKVISTNGPVENYSLSGGQTLEIVRKPLPDDVQQLWRTAIVETGSTPVSYVRVDVANVISMVIPPKFISSTSLTSELRMTSNFVPDPVSLHDAPAAQVSGDMAVKTVLIPNRVVNNAMAMSKKIQEVEKDLSVLVGKTCDQSESVITLPILALAKFNVTTMTLNEAACFAIKNDTHWILKTTSTSCGSLNSFKGSNPVMMNEIHLQFAEGSEFYRNPVRIPFTCKFAPGFLGFPVSEPDDEEYADYEESHLHPDEDDENDDEMYTMKILRKVRNQRRPELLVTRPEDQATVNVGDQLKVQTDFKTRSFLSLMIEKCWIADHASADQRSISEDKWLIYEGCPTSKNLSMLPTPMGSNPAFAFSVTEEHLQMGQFYIFCIMGLCSPVESLTSGNLVMCVDPVSKCASDDWHVGPAAQQLSRRGPLKVVDLRLPVEFDTANFSAVTDYSAVTSVNETENGTPESPSLHSSHVVMVGVPAEIAVAISLASFLIGAALTGMLCCIHHRRALPKSVRSHVQDSHEGSELQSMIASPSNGALPHAQKLAVSA